MTKLFNIRETRLGENIFNDMLRSFTIGLTTYIIFSIINFKSVEPTSLLFKFIVVFNFIVSISIFLLHFIFLLNKRITYIKEIEDGVKILSGGNLDHLVPLRENNELRSLSLSINKLSKIIKEQKHQGELARESNKDLIASVSHDIRTPLTSIIGYLSLLLSMDNLDSQTKDYISIALHKSESLKHLTSKLFEYSVIHSNRQNYNFFKIDFRDVFSQFTNENTSLLNKEGFEFESIEDVNFPLYVNIDPDQFNRVLENILSNLLKYANKYQSIYFYLSQSENHVNFSVQNKIEKHPVSSTSTGLGLPIIEKIVKAHDGNIIVDSDGEYFKISINLPLNQ